MNHAGALGTAEKMNALAGHLESGGGRFGPRIGSADGQRKLGERARRGAAIARQAGQGAQDLFYRKLHADDAGGADEEFVSGKVHGTGRFFVAAQGDRLTLGAGGAVGVAGVDDDSSHAAFGDQEIPLGDPDGRGDNQVLRENRRGRRRDVAREEGQVERAGFLEAAGGGGKAEAQGESGFGRGCGHFREASFARRSSSSAMAARTESIAVPPGTLFRESAARTLRLAERSASNAGEIFPSSSGERSVQDFPCRSAAFRAWPTRSCAWRKGTPFLTR